MPIFAAEIIIKKKKSMKSTLEIIVPLIALLPFIILGTMYAIECDKTSGPKYNNTLKRILMFFWCIIAGTIAFLFLTINKNARQKVMNNLKKKKENSI